MKNYLSKEFFDSANQLFRKMKTTCLMILVFASSLMATNVKSQVAKVNVALKNQNINKLIEAIESQTDYLFVYNKNEVDLNRNVSIEAKNSSVAEVLTNVFSNTDVVYAMEGTNIMLMPNSEAQQQQKKVSGKITDAAGASLPGVSVVVKGSATGVITDNGGSYNITIPENSTLVFSFVGMQNQEVVVGNKTSINIVLTEQTVGIEEVVAIGYGTKRKRDITSAVSVVNTW